MDEAKKRSLATIAAQALHFINEETGAVVPRIEPATTFAARRGLRCPRRFRLRT